MKVDDECKRRSLRMAREIEQRLKYGDVLQVGWAVDRLASSLCSGNMSADDLIRKLCENADIELWWLNLVMIYWGRHSKELEIATGMTREQWLDGI